MRNKFFLMLLLFFFMISKGTAVYASEYTVTETSLILYTVAGTPVYAEPNAELQPLVIVNSGLPFQVTGITSNGWFRVVTDQSYYIPGGYLMEQQVTQPLPAPAGQEYKEEVSAAVNSAEEAQKVVQDAFRLGARVITITSEKDIFYDLKTVAETEMKKPILDYGNYGILKCELHQTGTQYTLTAKKDSTVLEEKMVEEYVTREINNFNTGTVFEKVKRVHDFICGHVDYCYETFANKNVTCEPDVTLNTGAYEALVDGKAVCSGYALLFQKYMDKLGIPCYIARGNLGSGPHAWNLVNIDGQWYHIDCTNDDQDSYISDKWFLVGSSEAGYTSWGGIPLAESRYPY